MLGRGQKLLMDPKAAPRNSVSSVVGFLSIHQAISILNEGRVVAVRVWIWGYELRVWGSESRACSAMVGKHLLHLYQDGERSLGLLFSLGQDIGPSFEGLRTPRTCPLLTYFWMMPLFMGRLNKRERWCGETSQDKAKQSQEKIASLYVATTP